MSEFNNLPKVVASILNWNTPHDVLRLVEAISTLNYENIDIVVIDNKSTDDTRQIFRKQLSKAHIIFSDRNDGYAAGHFLTLDYAHSNDAELLWLLNADVQFVNNHVLYELIDAYHNNPNGLYGSLQIRRLTDGDLSYPRYIKQDDGAFHFKEYATEEQIRPSTFEVDWTSGFSILIPMAVINKFGFMDRTFFLYSEEVDYSWRMRQVNIKTYVVPTSQIIHEKHGSANNEPRLTAVLEYYRVRNQFLLIRRQKGLLRFLAIMLRFNHFSNIASILKDIILGIDLDNIETRNRVFLFCAWRDAILNRYGKTVDPERYL